MSAFFSAAVLLAISSQPRWIASAACLGVAALGKGLAPVALFVPVAAMSMMRKDRPAAGRLALAFAAFTAVALPWYVLCALRNGAEFPRVFFLQQTFGRLNSDALQHAQPWWFYAPVALLLLYPWFPLLALTSKAVTDYRTKTLAVLAIFGIVFFSIMKNKLPGYLLPLLPAIAVLMAIGYVRAFRPRWASAAIIAMLGLLPVAAQVLPEALSSGLRRAHFGSALWWPVAITAAIGIVCALRLRGFNRLTAAAALAACGFVWFQFAVFGAIDRAASARPLWRSGQVHCAPPFKRYLEYGLEYYAGRNLPPCKPGIIDQSRSPVYRTEKR
jgi:4-amino-4-deoxy-L-arabinose transferase-like glycosyltransferase